MRISDWSSDVCSSDLRFVANALPLPVEGVTPADTAIAEAEANPPNLGFTVAAPLGNLDALNCFPSTGKAEMLRIDRRIVLRFADAVPDGPVPVTCTLPAVGGRWPRVVGQLGVVPRAH